MVLMGCLTMTRIVGFQGHATSAHVQEPLDDNNANLHIRKASIQVLTAMLDRKSLLCSAPFESCLFWIDAAFGFYLHLLTDLIQLFFQNLTGV